MNINGKDLIVGRLGTIIAKKALLGETINVFNANELVISGTRKAILAKFKRFQEMGTHSTGPFQPKEPQKIAKKIVRGMLPYKQARGRTALDKIKFYNNIPKEFENEKLESIEGCDVNNTLISKYLTLKEISNLLGGKQ